jgi:hypothetical protein
VLQQSVLLWWWWCVEATEEGTEPGTPGCSGVEGLFYARGTFHSSSAAADALTGRLSHSLYSVVSERGGRFGGVVWRLAKGYTGFLFFPCSGYGVTVMRLCKHA